MYLTDELLDKLNENKKIDGNDRLITLPDIMIRSFAEVKELAGNSLSWGEKNFLYQQAQKELKENRMAESRILSRANPQLENAVRLGIRQSPMQRSYDDLFGGRASKFVKPGAVASMFSPAGYLTELYREARNLHVATSEYHLDKRRPDLASLSLSQSNMDDELSTLSLSNELLLNNIQTEENQDYDGVLEMLSTYRLTGMTPFHLPYEASRQAVMLQDEELAAFQRNPDVAARMDTASMLAIKNDISPELYKILIEDITRENARLLFDINFGEGSDSDILLNPVYLSKYYDLNLEDILECLKVVSEWKLTDSSWTDDLGDEVTDYYIGSDMKVNFFTIIRTPEKGYHDDLNYCNIHRVGNNEYYISVNFKTTQGITSIKKLSNSSGAPMFQINSPSRAGQAYKTDILDIKDIELYKKFGVFMYRYPEGSSTDAKTTSELFFTLKDGLPTTSNAQYEFILKNNKLIRLHKATNLPFSDIRTIIESNNNDLTITDEVLSQLFWVQHYTQRYGIDVSAALVLASADISQASHDGQPAAFTQLFNTPPLNGQAFSADGATVKLKPSDITDSFRTGVMKRAFQVNDTELYTLWSLAQGSGTPPDFTCTLGNLSLLYRVKLLADAHGLSVTELGMLLSVSPYAATLIAGLSGAALSRLLSFLALYTQWLKTQGWTASDLYLMTTDRYSTALSPDIENLIATLRDGLASQDLSQLDEAEIIRATAPFISAATQLDSTELATAVLQWLDQLKPQGLAVKAFLTLVEKDLLTPDETIQLVTFCQVMGQLALIVCGLRLTPGEISLAVTQPGKLIAGAKILPQCIDTVRALAHFHRWLQQCGTSATEMLSALGNGTLTPAQLAQAMTLDEHMVIQGLAQHDSKAAIFSSWPAIDVTLQWLDIATTLSITPAGVAALMGLKYTDPAHQPSYNDWVAISHTLQAGLSSQQNRQLQATLDEALSTAASAYAIKQIASVWVTNRDQLHSWLLLDNQVSAQVKTTRLAEAIASVQLYVNRALNGLEEGVSQSVKSRQYFTDWDTYNKRYSTWAGVSELVYYPENYIDPTLRIGQTGMMDTLLQEISQSQLNSDTLEDGFKNYLASFEEIANLSVISGYHDNTDADEGNTWFIGHSRTTPRQFYWRKLEHSKGADGRYTANAWSEWKEIVCGMTPHQNLVRPVIFKSRLHVVWVEEEIRKGDDGTTQNVFYRLKLSWLRYDGSWASPFTFDLISSIDSNSVEELLKALGGADESAGLFAAQYTTENVLAIYLYKKQDKYGSASSVSAAYGIFVYSDMKGVLKNKDELKSVISESLTHLDTTKHAEVNFRIAFNDVSYTIKPDKTNAYISLTSRVNNLSADYEKQTVTLTPEITVDYDEDASFPIYLGKLIDDYPWIEDGGYVSLSTEEFINYTPLGTECLVSSPEAPLSSEMIMAGFTSYNIIFMDASLDYSEGKDVKGYLVLLTLKSRKGFNQGLRLNKFSGFWLTDENDTPLPGGLICFVGWPDIDWWDDLAAGREYSGPEHGQKEFVYAGFVSADNLLKSSAINVHYLSWSENESNNWTARVATLDLPNDLRPGVAEKTAEATVTYPSPEPNKNITASAVSSVVNGDKVTHYFDPISFPWQALDASRGIERVLTFSAKNDGRIIAADKVNIILSSDSNDRPISLCHDASGAQYIQTGVYRTRLNTLFASQLVGRADRGIDAILSMDTQLLSEPKMGQGTYAKLELLKYTPAIHGDSMAFALYHDHDAGKDPIFRGMLNSRTTTTVNLFLPQIETPGKSDNLYVSAKYASSETDSIRFIRKNATNPDGWSLDVTHNNGTFPGLKSVHGLSVSTEPMDFSGANALYFWELFYYTPMMMFQRLLQEQNFTEALRWMNYIWNPSGYVINGEEQKYLWNVRPLEEDTSWNATPLDSVDPDAVAQNDPMHYKVASFMKSLDLLIARGDAAYRQLERDTLNEAKMWYLQALSLLGDEPWVAEDTDWSCPQLGDAASQTVQAASQRALDQVRRRQLADKASCSPETLMAPLLHPRINRKRELQKQREQRTANKASHGADSLATQLVIHEPQPADDTASRTANSLTALFFPQINEKLQGYWKLLAQRLFNLRHNLSIDGQPLSLPIFAAPADPAALLSAAVRTSQGGGALPTTVMPLYRFPVMLENARGMVGQLIQFGNTLLGLTERQDAEALAELLQTQGSELVLQNIRMQEKNLEEMDAELKVLQESRHGAQGRFDSYSQLYDEGVNSGEKEAMKLYLSSSTLSTTGKALHMSAAAADLVPNIYGMAVGGTRFGGLLNATGIGIEISSSASLIAADKISRSESYRRRRQEWEIQRNNAQAEMNQADAQLAALDIRREASELQKVYLETQQTQTQAQLTFLQSKFTNQALYNWLRGKLSAIYYQFYDLAVSRCLMAEQSWQYDLNDQAKTFIRPGAWQGNYAGLMAGETLMLNLAQMEQAYLQKNQREKEVTRTVCLSDVYAGLSDEDNFTLADKISELVTVGKGSAGTDENGLKVENKQLLATLKLSDLNIRGNYPDELGKTRRIKQISVTLPALVGPYQDIRAVLNYGGSVEVPSGCRAIAVSHGMNDSGQFMLDFNDARYLPFEGIPVDDSGSLTLSFPDATDRQKEILQSLSDIILHIRYTIRS
ncbi:insecticidal toxin complex protein A [Xenorhabdus bovienii]|uniref:Tc toxin subunit A-related protein n=1 Tax=Xenorhabdus bovienii TaxID=40576 RepID=UPI0023B2ADB6|nr:neuraminidase-like domain-containing protein [Xenorhabdus bovienii]MDE9495539.1 insecticidal toxin complex protein A [Xenorhabdus bovienii]MDE9503956.1 insecticidal toxin complex protein A [Xenorhabdus bovienii]MDE9527689.1 insecticidal toxin complex protein A [Xenorhabdus bovienii]MDE9570895.1 insecticidal toxin complex protein A [Xenorhabdus bovienii]